ncbi:MAG: hypothetical protein JWL90_231 [Chthoniobacteraceae bacterium]|nr:hypothetical protein [Chthoniobacteraceae bacterium]MDB6172353.1 hypothetical protein [Chthoniobacteraceae bacterium]
MQNEVFFIVRIVAAIVFFGALAGGAYMFRNFERLFGVDPHMPSENASSRSYSKVLIFLVWLHLLFASAAFALLFH